MTKIIVLTPVKNEDWILERFLSVTSQFADYIIIADQNSKDESKNICKKYPKAILLSNDSKSFNEADRQKQLIHKAREIVPGQKILLALDADEILAAHSTDMPGWKTMLNAEPGTVIYFEKPDLYLTPNNVIRYNKLWPLGYVDDGVEHEPKAIHSIRIPQPNYAKKLFVHDVKIMHYALTRLDSQRSKMVFYTMTENILKTNNFLSRRAVYKIDFDYKSGHSLEVTPQEWFEKWEESGIDMKSIKVPPTYWHIDEAFELISKYGSKRFWLDDIWNYDWDKIKLKYDKADITIIPPPYALKVGLKILDKVYMTRRKIVSSIFSKSVLNN